MKYLQSKVFKALISALIVLTIFGGALAYPPLAHVYAEDGSSGNVPQTMSPSATPVACATDSVATETSIPIVDMAPEPTPSEQSENQDNGNVTPTPSQSVDSQTPTNGEDAIEAPPTPINEEVPEVYPIPAENRMLLRGGPLREIYLSTVNANGTGYTYAANKISFTTDANGSTYRIYGTTTSKYIYIPVGVNADIILDGVNMRSNSSTIIVDGTANITLSGENYLESATGACIESKLTSSAITINGEGKLSAMGGVCAIGYSEGSTQSGDIIINGGIVDAYGGDTAIGSFNSIIMNDGEVHVNSYMNDVSHDSYGIGTSKDYHASPNTYVEINGGNLVCDEFYNKEEIGETQSGIFATKGVKITDGNVVFEMMSYNDKGAIRVASPSGKIHITGGNIESFTYTALPVIGGNMPNGKIQIDGGTITLGCHELTSVGIGPGKNEVVDTIEINGGNISITGANSPAIGGFSYLNYFLDNTNIKGYVNNIIINDGNINLIGCGEPGDRRQSSVIGPSDAQASMESLKINGGDLHIYCGYGIGSDKVPINDYYIGPNAKLKIFSVYDKSILGQPVLGINVVNAKVVYGANKMSMGKLKMTVSGVSEMMEFFNSAKFFAISSPGTSPKEAVFEAFEYSTNAALGKLYCLDGDKKIYTDTIGAVQEVALNVSELSLNVGTVSASGLGYDYSNASKEITITSVAKGRAINIYGSTTVNKIIVPEEIPTKLIFHNVSMDLSSIASKSPLSVGSRTTLEFDGDNLFKGGSDAAGIQSWGLLSEIFIKGPGSVTSYGGARAPGIGCSNQSVGRRVQIDSGSVNAYGGNGAPGIGAAYIGRINDAISIRGGNVKAYGSGTDGTGLLAAGIGTGHSETSKESMVDKIEIIGGRVESFGYVGIGEGSVLSGNTPTAVNKIIIGDTADVYASGYQDGISIAKSTVGEMLFQGGRIELSVINSAGRALMSNGSKTEITGGEIASSGPVTIYSDFNMTGGKLSIDGAEQRSGLEIYNKAGTTAKITGGELFINAYNGIAIDGSRKLELLGGNVNIVSAVSAVTAINSSSIGGTLSAAKEATLVFQSKAGYAVNLGIGAGRISYMGDANIVHGKIENNAAFSGSKFLLKLLEGTSVFKEIEFAPDTLNFMYSTGAASKTNTIEVVKEGVKKGMLVLSSDSSQNIVSGTDSSIKNLKLRAAATIVEAQVPIKLVFSSYASGGGNIVSPTYLIKNESSSNAIKVGVSEFKILDSAGVTFGESGNLKLAINGTNLSFPDLLPGSYSDEAGFIGRLETNSGNAGQFTIGGQYKGSYKTVKTPSYTLILKLDLDE